MRKPEVDYRQFRLSRLNEKRYAHLKLLGGWIVYFMLYFLTENFIPETRWHVIHCALDDVIPFREGFALLYCCWYVLIVISLGAFLLYDVTSIYSFDTPTGVCPSLHVAYSMGIASVWCRSRLAGRPWKLLMILSAALISISTAFVKQHSVVDIFAAIPLGLLAECLVFGNTGLRKWIERT